MSESIELETRVINNENERQDEKIISSKDEHPIVSDELEDSIPVENGISERSSILNENDTSHDESNGIAPSENLIIQGISDLMIITPALVEDETNQEPESIKMSATSNTHAFTVYPYVHDAVEEIVKEVGFLDGFTIDYSPGANIGDGFVATMVRATVNGLRNIDGTIKEDDFHLALKILPDSKSRRDFTGTLLFDREVYAYNKILPRFTQYQTDMGIKPNEGFFDFPKCHRAYVDNEKEQAFIIMDDIRVQSYVMENKYRSIGFDQCMKVVQKLGQLHALSFAMKEKNPELIEEFKQLGDLMSTFYTNEAINMMMVANLNKAAGTLEPNEEVIRDKILALNLQTEVLRLTNGALSEPYSVVSHGDCWINNMMFKYSRGKVASVCLLDWQICRYCSPALDLMYFIFVSTDQPFRQKHYDTIIQAYHQSLKSHLERLGCDGNKLFPFTALLRQLKLYGRFGLLMATGLIPLMTMPSDETPNLDKLSDEFDFTNPDDMAKMATLFAPSEKAEKAYKDRMAGVIRDSAKYGYF